MFTNPYSPVSQAQFAEQASEARNVLPDDRNGVFVLTLG